MFYSKTTGGFYDSAIHGDAIPVDAVEITVEEHAALLEGQSQGQMIVADEDGRPVLLAPAPETLERAIERTSIAITAHRDQLTQTGGFKVADKWFHSDVFSRTQFLGLNGMGANIPAGLKWKTMDGTFVDMTPELASQVFQAAAAQDIAIFAACESHKAALQAAVDVDEVAAYDWTVGWPEVFVKAAE